MLLTAKAPGNLLPAAVLAISFLSVKPEGLHHGCVLYREQNHFLFAFIGEFMPCPRRHNKEIAAFPVKALAIDDCMAAPFKDVIHRAIDLTMRLGVNARPNKLNTTTHGRQGRPAGVRV